jgi:hypothetical protein
MINNALPDEDFNQFYGIELRRTVLGNIFDNPNYQ